MYYICAYIVCNNAMRHGGIDDIFFFEDLRAMAWFVGSLKYKKGSSRLIFLLFFTSDIVLNCLGNWKPILLLAFGEISLMFTRCLFAL